MNLKKGPDKFKLEGIHPLMPLKRYLGAIQIIPDKTKSHMNFFAIKTLI